MAITEKEQALLLRWAGNDVVSDLGWEHPSAAAWNNDLCQTKSDAAVFGSLLVKGLVVSNGESCTLTDLGRAEVRRLKTSR